MKLALLTLASLMLIATPLFATDLTKIERKIAKEPAYKGKPKYCLLVFGQDAKHRVWLVQDGDVLYVDRNCNGDLTQKNCRIVSETDAYHEHLFKAGDLTLDGKRYGNLEIAIETIKGDLNGALADMPMFQAFMKGEPGARRLYTVRMDVPFEKPLPDLRDNSPIHATRHFAGSYDASGILQFAATRDQAPVIHFGGRWTMWPDGQQKLVRGRSEDLTLVLGTPGHGPGTFARICYDHLIPDSAKPRVQLEYPAKPGEKPRMESHVLEDRC